MRAQVCRLIPRLLWAWFGFALVVPGYAQLSVATPAQEVASTPNVGASTPDGLAFQAEQAYQRLLGQLSVSGKPAHQVIQALQGFLTQWPLHAGARLDLAMVHCELGNRSEAEALFQSLENEFSLPSGILQVITLQRERGCPGPLDAPASSGAQFWAEAFAGHSSNANLATRQERVVFGPQAPILSLDLSPRSRQRSDQFVGVNVGFSGALSHLAAERETPAGYLQLGLSHKAYLRSPWLDTSGLSLAVWQPLGGEGAAPSARMAASGLGFAFSQWWVDGRAQETALRVRSEFWGPLDQVHSGLRGGLSAALSEQGFAGNAAFNSQRVEIGVRLQQSLSRQSFATLALDRFVDRSLGLRPGGDRQGWAGQMAIYWPYAHGRFQAAWLVQKTYDQDPYNVLFFQERIRNNFRQQWLFRHDWPRPGGVHFFSQAVFDRANDVLDIFSFQSVSVQVGWSSAW